MELCDESTALESDLATQSLPNQLLLELMAEKKKEGVLQKGDSPQQEIVACLGGGMMIF